MKETIPSKSGVHKRTKKPTKKPTKSPVKTATQEPIVESGELNESSNHASSKGGLKKVRKAQFNRMGVLLHEIPVHG